MSQGNSSSATVPVSRLKITWAAAVRRALGVAPMPARAVVTALPMLAPITTAAAPCGPMSPLWAAARVMVMAALDDCISTVISRPMPSWASTESASVPCGRLIWSPRPTKACCSSPMPMNSRPKPASAVPSAPRRWCSPARRITAPSPTSGSASASTLNFRPTSATIQLVMVVPTLAPNTTHTAGASPNRPALTKPMAATPTAVDDCTMAVTSAPDPSACQRVRVALVKMLCRAGPAASLRPSVIMAMPSRNRPRPPTSRLIECHRLSIKKPPRPPGQWRQCTPR